MRFQATALDNMFDLFTQWQGFDIPGKGLNDFQKGRQRITRSGTEFVFTA